MYYNKRLFSVLIGTTYRAVCVCVCVDSQGLVKRIIEKSGVIFCSFLFYVHTYDYGKKEGVVLVCLLILMGELLPNWGDIKKVNAHHHRRRCWQRKTDSRFVFALLRDAKI